MSSNKVWDCNTIYVFFVIKTFCLLHNQKAIFKTSETISSKLWTLQVNYLLCILIRRSFKASFARMKVFMTQVFQRNAVKKKNVAFFFNYRKHAKSLIKRTLKFIKKYA